MNNIEEIKKRKLALEQGLNDINLALSHDDYSKPFEFKRMDRMTVGMVDHSTLKKIVGTCIDKGIGFDPNLALQHIEKEALDRYNTIVTENIKGKSIPELMAIRHELELFMLKERYNHYTHELAKSEKMLLEYIVGVSLEDNVETIKKKVSKKKV